MGVDANSIQAPINQPLPKAKKSPSTIRVFIGGLKPPSLSAIDIYNEIQKIIKGISTIIISPEDLNSLKTSKKSFLHVTLTQHKKRNVYEMVRRRFHRVSWRGCDSLRVEIANPSFLSRLKEEQQQNIQQPASEGDKEKANDEPKSKTPRFLRIRQASKNPRNFREIQYVKFDSKPRLCKTAAQCQSRSKPKKEKEKIILRCKHFRFTDSEEVQVIDHVSPSSSSSSSSSSFEDSSEDLSEESIQQEEAPSSEYIWSDDETDTNIIEVEEENGTESGGSATQGEESSSSSSSSEETHSISESIVLEEKLEKYEANSQEDELDLTINAELDNRVFQQLFSVDTTTSTTALEKKASPEIPTKTMARFDPTNMDSIRMFELQQEPTNNNSQREDSEEDDEKKDEMSISSSNTLLEQNDQNRSHSIEDATISEDNEKEKNSLYDQSTLENVFKEAREGTQSNNDTSASLFNFSLPESTHNSTQNLATTDSAFSFSFQLEQADADTLSKKQQDSNTLVLFQRRPFFQPFSQEELQKSTNDFLNIVVDNDQDAWDEERRKLTLDWKRKHKFAHKKKNQIRKRFKK